MRYRETCLSFFNISNRKSNTGGCLNEDDDEDTAVWVRAVVVVVDGAECNVNFFYGECGYLF